MNGSCVQIAYRHRQCAECRADADGEDGTAHFCGLLSYCARCCPRCHPNGHDRAGALASLPHGGKGEGPVRSPALNPLRKPRKALHACPKRIPK